jgi:uncharacterized membrane protein
MNLLKKNHIFIFLCPFFLVYNFIYDPGYWFDEWATLFSSNPNVSLNEIGNRIKGYETGIPENVPPYYYLILRFYFQIFGFTAENGRIFSIIFFVLAIFVFAILSKKLLGKNYFLSVLMFSLNPLLLWMANETRVDTFLVFFCVLNLLIFIICINKYSFFFYFLLFISNILILSIHPLTFSIYFSQIIFLIFCKYFKKKNYYFLFFLIICSFILYLLINHNYIADKLHNSGNHWANLNSHFFIGLFFNIFFGNIYFGAIYLLLFITLFFKNFNKMFLNLNNVFLLILIIFTYSMVIISSAFITPIAAPRYIIFLIPVLILWFNYNFFILNSSHSKNFFLYIFIFILAVSNIIFNNSSKPVKKPPIHNALSLIGLSDTSYIYPGDDIYFNLYISTLRKVVNKKFYLIDKIDLQKKNINSFAYLCLNNPSFVVGKKKLLDDPNCNKNFNNFKIKNILIIPDFKIIIFARL